MQKVDWKVKLRLFCIYMVAYSLFYIFPNTSSQFSPAYLPMFLFEKKIPLIPWTFIVYLSIYVNILFTVLMLNDRPSFYQYARMVMMAFVLCGTFFMAFPTIYPRPVYPEVQNWFVRFAMNLVGNGDSARNCFPSLHVAFSWVNFWVLQKKGPAYRWGCGLWALAIATTTLTTKQHYFIDIVGGFGVFGIILACEYLIFSSNMLNLSACLFRSKTESCKR